MASRIDKAITIHPKNIMLSDPAQFLQQVIEEAMAKSNAVADLPDSGPDREALLAQALGERLAALFNPEDDEPLGGSASDSELDPDLIAHYNALIDRNDALAAALGACECWGEDEDCEICRGEGRPGWTLPDRRLFLRFVKPALRAMRQASSMPIYHTGLYGVRRRGH